jgi:hypothetical protein
MRSPARLKLRVAAGRRGKARRLTAEVGKPSLLTFQVPRVEEVRRDALLKAEVGKPFRLTFRVPWVEEVRRDALLTAEVGKPSRLTLRGATG